MDVQFSSEHRDGFSLIFSILLALVTVAIAPHSSPREMIVEEEKPHSMTICLTFEGPRGVEDVGCADSNHSSMKADKMATILATERQAEVRECHQRRQENLLLGNDMTNEIGAITSKFDNLDPRCNIFRLKQDQLASCASRPTASDQVLWGSLLGEVPIEASYQCVIWQFDRHLFECFGQFVEKITSTWSQIPKQSTQFEIVFQ